jgi:hypothetical protein
VEGGDKETAIRRQIERFDKTGLLENGTYSSPTNVPYLKCFNEMGTIQDEKETLDYIYVALVFPACASGNIFVIQVELYRCNH